MISLAVLSILMISIPSFCFENKDSVGYVIPMSCCEFYASRQIPFSLLEDFYETSSFCLKPGIIFRTKKGRQICANPRNVWVQIYIFKLKQKKNTEEYHSQINYLYRNRELTPSEE
ncbi:C-C motif chemokine 4 homolog [Macrotis lagotis]|uniref:C-C motif chemokine 4 homolog n=1 Tax=Macrotis lagotis TaxID=92651 RepID=UPI003D68A02E